MAVVVFSAVHPGWLSSLAFYLTILTAVPVGLLLAPQSVRRDKRVLIGLALVLLALIGMPTFAAVTPICKYAFWAIECWFL